MWCPRCGWRGRWARGGEPAEEGWPGVPGSFEGLPCVTTERCVMDNTPLVLVALWNDEGWNPDDFR